MYSTRGEGDWGDPPTPSFSKGSSEIFRIYFPHFFVPYTDCWGGGGSDYGTNSVDFFTHSLKEGEKTKSYGPVRNVLSPPRKAKK